MKASPTRRPVSKAKPVMLRDAGVGIVGYIVFGVPFAVVGDFLWNWVSLRVATWVVPDTDRDYEKKGVLYALIITVAGILIDWPYLVLSWNVDLSKTMEWRPHHDFWLQAILILFPMVLLAGANFVLGVLYLRLGRREAAWLGLVMGVLTAPWVLLFAPYVFGWA